MKLINKNAHFYKHRNFITFHVSYTSSRSKFIKDNKIERPGKGTTDQVQQTQRVQESSPRLSW